jgi:hypothetical protein
MPYSTVQYTGNGLNTQFSVPFPFISRDHVGVTVDGVSKTFSWISDGLISIVPAPASGKLVTVQRNSSRNQRIVDFQDATVLTEQDLDLANTQAIYISQEAFDASDVASVTSEVTSLRDAAGVYAANAAASAADALQYKQNAASSADSASFFSSLAATNAASAEALNRVAKVGDTMTGGLNINLTGATSYGVASYLRFKDTAAGNPDYRTYGWYQWRPNFGPSAFAINGTGNYASCLSMGPEDDAGVTNGNAFINFYNHPDGSPNVIRLGPSIKLHLGYNSPTNGGPNYPELYSDNVECEHLHISSTFSLGTYGTIHGMFGSASVATQTWIQSDNGAFTSVPIVQPPAGTHAEVACYASSTDPDNSSVLRLRAAAAGTMGLYADKTGTGTYQPLKFYTSGTERMSISAAGAVAIPGTLTAGGLTVSGAPSVMVYGPKANTALVLSLSTNDATNQMDLLFTRNTNVSYSIQSLEQGVGYKALVLNPSGGKVGIGITPTVPFHFSSADAAVQMLFAGTTKGMRFFTSSVGAAIEGIDYTGSGSYQPLYIGGSSLTFTVSNVEKAKITATGALTAKTSGYYTVTEQSTSTTTHTIDFTASQYYKLTMGHNIATLTLTAPERACVVQLEIVQDATGSRTMAWPASLKWPASYATIDKTISTAANSRDLLVLRWNGTDYVANLLKGIA